MKLKGFWLNLYQAEEDETIFQSLPLFWYILKPFSSIFVIFKTIWTRPKYFGPCQNLFWFNRTSKMTKYLVKNNSVYLFIGLSLRLPFAELGQTNIIKDPLQFALMSMYYVHWGQQKNIALYATMQRLGHFFGACLLCKLLRYFDMYYNL